MCYLSHSGGLDGYTGRMYTSRHTYFKTKVWYTTVRRWPVLEQASHYGDTLSGGKNLRSLNAGTEWSASRPGRFNLEERVPVTNEEGAGLTLVSVWTPWRRRNLFASAGKWNPNPRSVDTQLRQRTHLTDWQSSPKGLTLLIQSLTIDTNNSMYPPHTYRPNSRCLLEPPYWSILDTHSFSWHHN